MLFLCKKAQIICLHASPFDFAPIGGQKTCLFDLYLTRGFQFDLYLTWGFDLYLTWGFDLYLTRGFDLYLTRGLIYI